jgi:hypothetical protein
LSNDFTCQIVKKDEYCEIRNNDIPRDMYLNTNIILPISAIVPTQLPDLEITCIDIFKVSRPLAPLRKPVLEASSVPCTDASEDVSNTSIWLWILVIAMIIAFIAIVVAIGGMIIWPKR